MRQRTAQAAAHQEGGQAGRRDRLWSEAGISFTDPRTSLLDLQPDLICIVTSQLEDKASMKSTCKGLTDIIHGTVTSLQWRQMEELHALPAQLLAILPSLSRMDFSPPPPPPRCRILMYWVPRTGVRLRGCCGRPSLLSPIKVAWLPNDKAGRPPKLKPLRAHR